MAWYHEAACNGHVNLGPDAWFDVANGYPGKEGVFAVKACLSCPVMEICRMEMMLEEPKNMIAGGGWFDNKGVFKEPTNVPAMIKWRKRQPKIKETV
jgi:hypothetical protein